MDPIWFVAIGVLVAAAAGVSWYLKKRRREEWARISKQMGFRFSPEDPFNLPALPFTIMREGDGRGAENVAWGTYRGRDITAFDYWYYEESRDSDGSVSRSYKHFTCAYLKFDVPLPELRVSPESFLSRVADHVGFRDIDLESEEFNRAFQVEARDRRFATYVLAPRMMEWLLYTKGGFSYEVFSRYLMCWSGKLRPPQVMQLVAALAGFHERIPDVVWTTYGEGYPTTGG